MSASSSWRSRYDEGDDDEENANILTDAQEVRLCSRRVQRILHKRTFQRDPRLLDLPVQHLYTIHVTNRPNGVVGTVSCLLSTVHQPCSSLLKTARSLSTLPSSAR